MSLSINNSCNDIINGISLEILISGCLQAGIEWSKTRSFPPPYAKLYFILGGDAFIAYGSKRMELLPGHSYLIPSGLVYDNGCLSGIDFLYFNIRLKNGIGEDLLSRYPYPLESEFPCERTHSLIEKYLSSSPAQSLLLKSELLAALLELLAKAPEVELSSKSRSQSVCRALAYIHDNLSVKLRIDDICRNVYSARSTLVKKFSEETGMSIGEYINSEIMTICEQLLCETDLSINEISERFDFCDQFYFSRCFKAHFGETPQRYRKNHSV